MRQRRALVPSVTLSDYPLPANLWRDWPEFTGRAQVEIDSDDNASRLDLRWLVGVPMVWVESFDRQRLDALCTAAAAAGACRVVGMHLQIVRTEPQVIAMTDTEGALAWPN